jgi:ATP-binding cassette subfamily F protein uup
VIEEVKEIAEFITMGDGSQLSASKFLETFLFPPEKQYNFIDKLSGGEKKRLQLLKLLVTSPNFLILDEPTNDFDIDTLNVLEDFLINFKGCLLLVSHDRYFMDHLVDQLFVFEGDGKIRLFNGNYSDYRNWADGQEEEPEVKEIKSEATAAQPTDKKKLSYKEKQELDSLPGAIEKLEKQKSEVNSLLNSGSTDHVQLTTWGEQLEQITLELDQKTARWIELSEFE